MALLFGSAISERLLVETNYELIQNTKKACFGDNRTNEIGDRPYLGM